MMRCACVWLLVVVACGPKTDAAEGGDSDSTGGPVSATAESSETAVADTGTNLCEELPWHGCQPVADCSVEECGVAGAGYDENGCLRPGCGGDEDCYAGEVCYHPVDWGGCASSGTFCEEDPATGVCACGGTDDCNGSWCALEGTVPSPECLLQTEEEPCYALGCEAFVLAQLVALGPMGCECLGQLGTCLYFPGEGSIGGEAAFTAYYRQDGSGEVRLFPTGYEEDPVGWIRCSGNPGEPESCACTGCP